jgi:hypothetical protein
MIAVECNQCGRRSDDEHTAPFYRCNLE